MDFKLFCLFLTVAISSSTAQITPTSDCCKKAIVGNYCQTLIGAFSCTAECRVKFNPREGCNIRTVRLTANGQPCTQALFNQGRCVFSPACRGTVAPQCRAAAGNNNDEPLIIFLTDDDGMGGNVNNNNPLNALLGNAGGMGNNNDGITFINLKKRK